MVTQRDLAFLADVEARLGAKLAESARVDEKAALALLTPVAKAMHEANSRHPFDAGE